MTAKHHVDFGSVQETLLIPLYARAQESRRKRPWMRDPRAVEIVEGIDYDFARFQGPSLMGSVLRGAIYDHWVAAFLGEHPKGTVVEIGAGLNTRYERLDNGKARWLEIDLPDSMELRRRFFDDTARRTLLASSVADADWVAAAHDLPGPWCFVSEAVIIYLREPDVRTALGNMAGFAGSTLLMDTWGRWIVDNVDKHDALRKLPVDITWSCDDAAELEGWGIGLQLQESRTLAQAPRPVKQRLPLRIKAVTPIMALMRQTKTYRLNRYSIR